MSRGRGTVDASVGAGVGTNAINSYCDEPSQGILSNGNSMTTFTVETKVVPSQILTSTGSVTIASLPASSSLSDSWLVKSLVNPSKSLDRLVIVSVEGPTLVTVYVYNITSSHPPGFSGGAMFLQSTSVSDVREHAIETSTTHLNPAVKIY